MELFFEFAFLLFLYFVYIRGRTGLFRRGGLLLLDVLGKDVDDDLVVLLLLQTRHDDGSDKRFDALHADWESAPVDRILRCTSSVQITQRRE